MMNQKDIFIENLLRASGSSAISKANLYKNLQTFTDIQEFIHLISKAVDNYDKEWLSCDYLFLEDVEEFWTDWHHIDESHSDSWGFHNKQTGCYIYGLFNKKPTGIADPLDKNVFYIGESRSPIRNAMLGRKNDFKSSVRNEVLAPYGVGIMFKEQFGKENFDFVYQAYYPLPAYKCKEKETELLINYFKTYGNIPRCNHQSDYKRIQKLSTNLMNFLC